MDFPPLPAAPEITHSDKIVSIPSFDDSKRFANECVEYMRTLMEDVADTKICASADPGTDNLIRAKDINNQTQALMRHYSAAYIEVAKITNAMMAALMSVMQGEQEPTLELATKYRITYEALTQLLGCERFMTGVSLRLEEASYVVRADILTASQLTAMACTANIAVSVLDGENLDGENVVHFCPEESPEEPAEQ